MSEPTASAGVPHSHDHAGCIAGAVAQAERLCTAAGVRLTPLRRAVLEIIWQGHAASGAYEILGRLQARGRSGDGPGGGATPVTVYRALEFLQERGLVHRLESVNAFVGCPSPGAPHRAVFLICRQCRGVAELIDDGEAEAQLRQRARAVGFTPERVVVELSGLCAACAAAATTAPPAR